MRTDSRLRSCRDFTFDCYKNGTMAKTRKRKNWKHLKRVQHHLDLILMHKLWTTKVREKLALFLSHPSEVSFPRIECSLYGHCIWLNSNATIKKVKFGFYLSIYSFPEQYCHISKPGHISNETFVNHVVEGSESINFSFLEILRHWLSPPFILYSVPRPSIRISSLLKHLQLYYG